MGDIAGHAWSGARMIFMPFLMVGAAFVVARAIAWIVKAKRGF